MGARIRIPLWVSLPCLAVSVVGLGAVAAGAVSMSVTRGYLTRQTDSSLLACAGEATGQLMVDWPAPVPSGACDTELLSASGQLIAPPAPGEGAGPVIPADRSWLAAHMSRPVTVPGADGTWRVLLKAVRYRARRILYVYGPDDVQYVISGQAGHGPSGSLVVMARMAGIGRLTAEASERYAAAVGAVLVLLAVAALAVTRAVLRPLRQPARFGPFIAASVRVSERMDASRAAETAARRSVAEITECLSEVSQELRTSVSIVRGSAESCRHRGKPRPATDDQMMRRVADEITRMQTLVAQLDADPLNVPPAGTDAGAG
jgi:signal transduction histidine kinase